MLREMGREILEAVLTGWKFPAMRTGPRTSGTKAKPTGVVRKPRRTKSPTLFGPATLRRLGYRSDAAGEPCIRDWRSPQVNTESGHSDLSDN